MPNVRFFRHSTRLFRYHVPTSFILLGVSDFLLLMLALYLGLEFRFQGDGWQGSFGSFFPKAILYASVILLSMIGFGVYKRQPGRFIEAVALRLTGAVLLGFIPLALIFYIAPTFFMGRGVLALTGIFSLTFLMATRLYYRKYVGERNTWSKVLVLGAGKGASSIAEAVNSGDLANVNVVGYVELPGESSGKTGIKPLNLNAPLVQYAEEAHVDEIVLAVDDRRAGLPSKELVDCKMSGIDVVHMLTFFERSAGKIRLDMLYPSWLYLSDGFHESVFRRLGKRVFDVGAALFLLPILLPFIVMAMTGIFLESKGKGSIFYSQRRIKQDGEPFKIYKFRSMVVDAEQDGVARWASKDDARITWVGSLLRKARLDEIPQLYNVLKGDMSFVGPRPERPEFVEQLKQKSSYYDERHRVKPGVTGWAQICYPYGESIDDGLAKLEYDLYYVKNYSIFLDLLILLQTAEVVLLGKGAQ